MSDQKSGAQRLFARIFPKRWLESMEAESRTWMVRCPNCGFERSVWDIGGVRWKAYGNPRWRMPCPNCGNTSWHTVYRKREIV